MVHRGWVFMSLQWRILQFKHHLRVEPAGDNDAALPIGERERFRLRGRHAPGRGLHDVPVRLGGSTGRTGKGA
ncbi:hypothetical protein [Sorangium sp. So ce385]|uniref:hypothetical protein n=1 Tax=Sorangium sp. So ce385 TaxID=3133308 RepID=UPI003F5B7E95